jgi:mannonate dehydratase
MKMVMRWFGPQDDPVPLRYIRQVPGVGGVVTSLLRKLPGEVWSLEEVREMRRGLEAEGLESDVIESVNIHEDIKLGADTRDTLIDAYIETMKNLKTVGVKAICYNFMPVLDWARSRLYYDLPDGTNTMFFSEEFIRNTTPRALAERYAEETGGIAMPGWEPERLAHLEETLRRYEGMTRERYWENAKYFLDRVIPYAEELDIKMAIHPDDPPVPIFGLPRMINSAESIRAFLALHPSTHNGLTLCTGSLGADPKNDLPAIIREFGSRIYFAHIRNLKFLENGDFYESAHPTACGSLDMKAIVKAFKDVGFEGYVRPDHGRMIWDEKGRPGYGLYDRALGVTYLLGLFEAIDS